MRKVLAASLLLAVVGARDAGATDAGTSTTETLGSVGAIALPAAAIVAVAAHKDGKGALEFAAAYAAAMGLVYVLKPTINRQRPDGGGESFPSGHTASAFASAAFLERRYGWRYGAPAYALATFVAYSRVEAKRHWTTDVIAAGAIGIGTNFIFTRRYHKIAAYPVVQPRAAGVTIEVRW